VKDRPDAIDLRLRFRLVAGSAQETGVSLDLEFGNWSTRNYVLLPGAVYNGHRFCSRRIMTVGETSKWMEAGRVLRRLRAA
jgi:hypothetical protein